MIPVSNTDFIIGYTGATGRFYFWNGNGWIADLDKAKIYKSNRAANLAITYYRKQDNLRSVAWKAADYFTRDQWKEKIK